MDYLRSMLDVCACVCWWPQVVPIAKMIITNAGPTTERRLWIRPRRRRRRCRWTKVIANTYYTNIVWFTKVLRSWCSFLRIVFFLPIVAMNTNNNWTAAPWTAKVEPVVVVVIHRSIIVVANSRYDCVCLRDCRCEKFKFIITHMSKWIVVRRTDQIGSLCRRDHWWRLAGIMRWRRTGERARVGVGLV